MDSIQLTNRNNETVARAALISNGWTVHTSDTDEVYAFLATDPVGREHYRMQVRKIRQRTDRRGEFVVSAKIGTGEVYTNVNTDYIIGVLEKDGVNPRVFMFECRGRLEYWAAEQRAADKWMELDLPFYG